VDVEATEAAAGAGNRGGNSSGRSELGMDRVIPTPPVNSRVRTTRTRAWLNNLPGNQVCVV
jgi:hypothetical protein